MTDSEHSNGKRPPADQPPEAGNKSLLERLYKTYWRELCHYVLSKYGSGPPDPEDVVQTTFTRFAALENPQAIENPRAFLYRTAHNVMVSHYRHQDVQSKYEKEKIELETEGHGGDLDTERVLISRERLKLLEAAMWRMPLKRRKILIMHRFDGLSYAEISRRIGLSQSVIKRHVEKAMRDLQRACFAEEPLADKGENDGN